MTPERQNQLLEQAQTGDTRQAIEALIAHHIETLQDIRQIIEAGGTPEAIMEMVQSLRYWHLTCATFSLLTGQMETEAAQILNALGIPTIPDEDQISNEVIQ